MLWRNPPGEKDVRGWTPRTRHRSGGTLCNDRSGRVLHTLTCMPLWQRTVSAGPRACVSAWRWSLTRGRQPLPSLFPIAWGVCVLGKARPAGARLLHIRSCYPRPVPPLAPLVGAPACHYRRGFAHGLPSLSPPVVPPAPPPTSSWSWRHLASPGLSLRLRPPPLSRFFLLGSSSSHRARRERAPHHPPPLAPATSRADCSSCTTLATPPHR